MSRTDYAALTAGSVEAVDRQLRELSDRQIAELAEDAPAPGKAWAAMTRDEKRCWRAVNEIARRARVNEQQQARAAEDAARERAAVEAAQAEARRLLRANFQGTEAEFNEAWPRLWASYRDRQALDGAAAGYEAALAAKRRELGGL
jgi:hypothetical protein